jgi:hypothetical protein
MANYDSTGAVTIGGRQTTGVSIGRSGVPSTFAAGSTVALTGVTVAGLGATADLVIGGAGHKTTFVSGAELDLAGVALSNLDQDVTFTGAATLSGDVFLGGAGKTVEFAASTTVDFAGVTVTGLDTSDVPAPVIGETTQISYNKTGVMIGNNNLTFNDTTNVLSVPTVSLGDGSLSASSVSFASATNTGLFLDGGDRLGVAQAGVLRMVPHFTTPIATNNVAFSVLELSLGTGTCAGIVMPFTIFVNATSALMALTGTVQVTGLNDGVTPVLSVSTTDTVAATAGATLTATWSATYDTDKLFVRVQPNYTGGGALVSYTLQGAIQNLGTATTVTLL